MKHLAFALTIVLAACGGGGGGSSVALPSTQPSAAPSNAPQASSNAVTFSSGTAQSVTVTESGYSGAFTESDTCNPLTGQIAAIAAGASSSGSQTYAVTPVSAGTCAVTVSDSTGKNVKIGVTVSTAAITVQ
jgi:hypothetical protein